MFVRLAFAVAVHVDPDILVIDEALAVGDMLFQRKCFQRLATLTADPQRVLILVSHDLRQISRVCARTLLLQEGGLLADGPSHKVCGQAGEINYGDLKQMAQAAQGERARIETTGEMCIRDSSWVMRSSATVVTNLPMRFDFRVNSWCRESSALRSDSLTITACVSPTIKPPRS